MSDDDARERALAARRAQQDLSVNVRRLFPKPGPKLYSFGVWWVFGLYVLFYASAPYTPTRDAHAPRGVRGINR